MSRADKLRFDYEPRLYEPPRRTPCQLDWHSWSLVMPVDGEPYAVCQGGCNRRATPEDAQRNMAWQDRELAARSSSENHP